MLTDAHVHLADLLDRDPGFPERLFAREGDSLRESLGEARSASPWTCCAASHAEAEWDRVESLRGRLPPFVSSFGIHPQWTVWDHADFLAGLAEQGRIAAIGEAGFDFYGDRPQRVRTAENIAAQRAAFEYQLDLAERLGLPLLLHLRKAMDMAFAYAKRLRRLPAAIFHSYSGTGPDAASLLAKGVPAYFSFGASVVNGNKRAAAACADVPADRLLAETDAPWQPPRGADFCRAEDISPILEGIAKLREARVEDLAETIERNFHTVYHAPRSAI